MSDAKCSKYENWRRFSRIRTHALHIGTRTLYVNAYHLAELSQFFEKLFFDNFKEAKEQCAEFHDEDAEDVAEFLSVVSDTQLFRRKPIDEYNCGLMIRYADIWAVNSLKERCEEFLIDVFPLIKADFHCALSIVSMASQHNISPLALENAIGRLAYFGVDALIQANACDAIANSRAIAALFASAAKCSRGVNSGHSWLETDHQLRECAFFRCTSQAASGSCVHCGFSFCSDHKTSLSCPHSSSSLFSTHISISTTSSKKVDDKPPSLNVKVIPYRDGFAHVEKNLLSSSS